MGNFKEFYESTLPPEIESVEETNTKWGVVLFVGDYNPIHKEEFKRVKNFVNKYMKENRDKFARNVDIGLVTDYDNSEESRLIDSNQNNLSIEERQFLTTRLFGLKLYPMQITSIAELLKFADTEDEKQELSESTSELIEDIKENFINSNVLLVLRPNDQMTLESVQDVAEVIKGEVNLGVIVQEDDNKMEEFIGRVPVTGNIIKAIVLMDAKRPNPEDLKHFAYEYNLQENIEELKRIHFKTGNDRYLEAFSMVFPEIATTLKDQETSDANTRVVMEMLKQMYLKHDER